MNVFAYEFTGAQRQVMDRYTRFLGSLPVTFSAIPVVFERLRRSGHQLAVRSKDSRLENAPFNERYLQELWQRTEELKLACARYVGDLDTFTRESLEITRRTSRSELVSQVDFRLFSLSGSPVWKLFPPTDVPDLIHELALRFSELGASIRQLKYTVTEVHNESFGLKSVFINAMDHRSCNCHTTPLVAQELFGDSTTAPVWDYEYSSSDPAVRAAEYKADIAVLFNGFVIVSSQMNLFVEEVYQRVEGVANGFLMAKRASNLGELNFKLADIGDSANESLAMLSHFEGWLGK